MGWAIMIAGLLIALAASSLLVLGVIESGVAVAVGVLGIGLIAASGRWMRSKPKEKFPPEHLERTIYSPDHQVRALVKHHAYGNYRVEIQKVVHEYTPDAGSHDRWERQSNVLVTDTLANAVEVAARSIGAGTDDFFSDHP